MKNQMKKGGEQKMQKKAIIYCRAATYEQTSSRSLEDQMSACLQFTSKNGFKVIRTVMELGSGSKINNQLQEAIKDIKAKEAEALVVSSIDRLGRNLLVIKRIIDEIEINNGEVRFANEPNSPDEARLFRAISLGVFDYFSRQISVAIKRGLEARKQRLAAQPN